VSLELRGLKIDSFQCRNHPEREGVGICVACRRVFCVECSTKIEGVNFCRECLAKRGPPAASRKGSLGGIAAGVFAAAVILGSLALTTGALVLFADARAHAGKSRVANRSRMEAIAKGLRAYKKDTGSFPPSESETEALAALLEAPEGVAGWKGPYLDIEPEWKKPISSRSGSLVERGVPDAFGHPVRYWVSPAGERCVIGSAGADGVFESQVKDAKPIFQGSDGAEAEGDDLVLVVQ
jgi:hypothetical protein